MLVVKRNEILNEDGCVVGFYKQHKSDHVTSDQILDLFKEEVGCTRVLLKMRLPSSFEYIWISDIAVRPKWRRKGIATRLIDSVCGANTLVACALGSGSLGNMRMRHDDRVTFYKSIGFKVIFGSKHDYAFRYGQKEKTT